MTTTTERWLDHSFVSHGEKCAAWHFAAASDRLAGPAGRPAVVMAHGFGGTMDSGLVSFAEHLSLAGLDVLAFDYRGFGSSGGARRQVVSLKAQADDYRAALTEAATLPGVDPDRLVLWGVSLSGGTVLEVAAGRTDIAALIALTPLVSGIAAARHAMPSYQPASSLRTSVRGVRDRVAAARGARPVTVPLVGKPGEAAVLTLPGMYEDYLAITGPQWRNEVGASISLEVLARRSHKAAATLTAPALFQIADYDRCAPPHAALKAGFAAKALVHHYPCDHFDVYASKRWHDDVVRHQVRFLTRTLQTGQSA